MLHEKDKMSEESRLLHSCRGKPGGRDIPTHEIGPKEAHVHVETLVASSTTVQAKREVEAKTDGGEDADAAANLKKLEI